MTVIFCYFSGYYELAWTIVKHASVARKQGLIELCVHLLSRIQQLPKIDIPEALKRIKEQTKCYRDLPSHYTAGLDLLNGINLEHFKDSKQQAELFLMKAEFQAKLGFTEEANQSYGTAIALYDSFGKGKVTAFSQNIVHNPSVNSIPLLSIQHLRVVEF